MLCNNTVAVLNLSSHTEPFQRGTMDSDPDDPSPLEEGTETTGAGAGGSEPARAKPVAPEVLIRPGR